MGKGTARLTPYRSIDSLSASVNGHGQPRVTVPPSAKEITVIDVHHQFGEFTALGGVSLQVQPGEFITLLGPSGSGKTTLLRIIAGMVRPTKGRIHIGGRDVTDVDASKRAIGFVFQNYALFPHLTVFENIAFPLRLRRVNLPDIKERVTRALALVHLEGLEKRYPAQLSGGQQQRVALGRAIVFNPAVLLMDEPLGSLDKRLRQSLQFELRRLQREVRITTIYVTHDQEEAFTMSDRIAVMSEGAIHQVDSPAGIYLRPADSFVGHFVGDLNFFNGRLMASGERMQFATDSGLGIVLSSLEDAPTGACGWGIRPEKVRVRTELKTTNRYPAVVKSLTFQGDHYRAELTLRSGDAMVADLAELGDVTEGGDVEVGWDPSEGRVFPIGPADG